MPTIVTDMNGRTLETTNNNIKILIGIEEKCNTINTVSPIKRLTESSCIDLTRICSALGLLPYYMLYTQHFVELCLLNIRDKGRYCRRYLEKI